MGLWIRHLSRPDISDEKRGQRNLRCLPRELIPCVPRDCFWRQLDRASPLQKVAGNLEVCSQGLLDRVVLDTREGIYIASDYRQLISDLVVHDLSQLRYQTLLLNRDKGEHNDYRHHPRQHAQQNDFPLNLHD